MTFGDRLQIALDRKGMLQKELAERIGVTSISINRYIHNVRMPDINILKKICNVLDISADWFIGRKEDK